MKITLFFKPTTITNPPPPPPPPSHSTLLLLMPSKNIFGFCWTQSCFPKMVKNKPDLFLSCLHFGMVLDTPTPGPPAVCRDSQLSCRLSARWGGAGKQAPVGCNEWHHLAIWQTQLPITPQRWVQRVQCAISGLQSMPFQLVLSTLLQKTRMAKRLLSCHPFILEMIYG